MKGPVCSRTQIHLPARMLKNNEKKVTTTLGAGSRRLTDQGNDRIYRISNGDIAEEILVGVFSVHRPRKSSLLECYRTLIMRFQVYQVTRSAFEERRNRCSVKLQFEENKEYLHEEILNVIFYK